MGKLLLDESPLLVQQTLAAWIGLNEAIFIQQLHYILTQHDSMGKFADGKKWYRDKARDFSVKYFAFWDESIVKRIIANLRADGLLLARSDLNKNPQDRSLWYSINYDALDKIDSPVERISNKIGLRKKARQVRTEKEQANKSSDYTKVHNATMLDDSTLCNDVPLQNVPLTQVQNVPTPKESFKDKDTKTKERAQKPRTVYSRPDIIPAVQVFVEESGKHCLTRPQEKEVGNRVGIDPARLKKWRLVVKTWIMRGHKPTNADGMLNWLDNGIPTYENGQQKNGIPPPPVKRLDSEKETVYQELMQKQEGL
jgi:hypothetical protein